VLNVSLLTSHNIVADACCRYTLLSTSCNIVVDYRRLSSSYTAVDLSQPCRRLSAGVTSYVAGMESSLGQIEVSQILYLRCCYGLCRLIIAVLSSHSSRSRVCGGGFLSQCCVMSLAVAMLTVHRLLNDNTSSSLPPPRVTHSLRFPSCFPYCRFLVVPPWASILDPPLAQSLLSSSSSAPIPARASLLWTLFSVQLRHPLRVSDLPLMLIRLTSLPHLVTP
jgi:hypothetical protein